MHLNYHFLRFLCPALEKEFMGGIITSCFSQSKDELILEISSQGDIRYVRAHLLPPDIYLSFPVQFQRAKRNSIDLFSELLGDRIEGVKVMDFERAFYFLLESGKKLVFKLHGNRSNVLLFSPENGGPLLLFRNEISEDKSLRFEDLFNPLDLSWERFKSLEGNASQFLPTLGPEPRKWLKEKGYPELSLEEKWKGIQEVLDLLDSPLFCLIEEQDQVKLTLLPTENPLKTFADPIEAVNELFYIALVRGNFNKDKNRLLKNLQEQIKRTENYLQKSREKLSELVNSPPPSQLADVIMANLHQFFSGQTGAELDNFYTGEKVWVKLKRNQKPQDLAESLYRKSKNRQLEIDQLEKTLAAKEKQWEELQHKLEELASIEEFRGLKSYQREHIKSEQANPKNTGLPFRVFEFEGYTIWVGKSSKDNDEMIRRYIHKDDLWLHARQAAGSHVVIRTKGMPKIPNPVLERAAGLAAYYSKLKSETLAPVIFTEAKYIRKVKGSPAGAVMVDREKVVMVAPQGPDGHLAKDGRGERS
ncbi:NFACT RNA binding domain-containing protein [Algoriphagus confluentis]|uniref:NFACT RNA-binding domain-containing protein n=1 Tax=Algoriphagus confluentis TaxID=1697556 RepID=A0ABQ6PPH0_9BACT|nr:hypothetical protein Aconfl_24740 [Algoriphagus confluentis]